jgi:hypothetical protein
VLEHDHRMFLDMTSTCHVAGPDEVDLRILKWGSHCDVLFRVEVIVVICVSRRVYNWCFDDHEVWRREAGRLTDSADPLRKSTVRSRATSLIIFQTITPKEISDDYIQNVIIWRLLYGQS